MAHSTSNPREIINEIKKDVGKIAVKLAQRIANQAYEDFSQAHKAIMDSYYAGYTPVEYYHYSWRDPKTGKVYSGITHGYRRTYNLYEGSREPVGVFRSGQHSYKAIFRASSKNMEDYTTTKPNGDERTFPASGVFDLVWNQGIRGLPPGYRGHVGDVNIKASIFGINLSGYPDDAMVTFVNEWGNQRGKDVADRIAENIDL